MAGDRAEGDVDPRPEARIACRPPAESRRRIDVGDVEAPSEQPDERGALGGCHRGRTVIADQRHAARALVEALRVRSDDVAVDASVPTFEDLAVLVDEEVVADVVPAVREHVVALDAADDRRRLRPSVRIRPGCVVDNREAKRVRVVRQAAADTLVRSPARSGEDERRAGGRHRAKRLCARVAPHVIGANAAHPAEGPDPDAIRRPRPVGAPKLPAAGPQLVVSGVWAVILRRSVSPPTPASRDAACSKRDRAASTPVQADEVEPMRRATGPGSHVARGETRSAGERSRRCQGEENEGEGDQLHRRPPYGSRDCGRAQGRTAGPRYNSYK